MKERLFRFKLFSVYHSASAMKVGVDGVLLGAWANVEGGSLLDVGTGCGVIALMAAQRNDSALIAAIDIDTASVNEANQNFAASPWKERLHAFEIPFLHLPEKSEYHHRFNRIISNPPFYDAGVIHPLSQREKSRHSASLGPQDILLGAPKLLLPNGSVSVVTPITSLPDLHKAAGMAGLLCTKLTYVATVEGKQPKRLLSEWMMPENPLVKSDVEENVINIETGAYPNRRFSVEYRKLCSPFYLHMDI